MRPTGLAHRRLLLRLDRPPLSVRFGLGSLVVLLGALAGVAGLLVLGVNSGSFPLSLSEIVDGLLGGGDERSRYVLWDLRLPRLLAAVLVGVALAVSGAIFQSVSRNPLAAPDIIGVNGGAALLAVGVIVLGLPSVLLAPAALSGGLAAAALVYVLAWRDGIGGRRLILIGIGVAAVTESGISFLLTRGRILEVQQATVWLVGDLSAASWRDAGLLAMALVALLPLAFVLGRGMATLQLGDDASRALGLRTERLRLALIVVAVAFAAVSVTVAGPIAFVAFIAPHLARRLARTSGSGELAAAAAIGALLVLAADIVARRVISPQELPVGIVTVLLGGPYFLWLLVRADRPGAGA